MSTQVGLLTVKNVTYKYEGTKTNVLKVKHDLIRIRVVDKAEERIPAGAIFTFEDLETGERFVMDNMKREYKMNASGMGSKRNLITVYTDEDYVKPLKQFFKKRGLR